jgi:hypothetical protein
MAGTQKRTKHVPERTCIACRQKKPKWEMVRIVRTPQGNIEIDSRGKKAGRGAYLCKSRSCWEAGLVKKRLEHYLKAELSSEQRAALLEYGKTLSGISSDTAYCSELRREGACE